MLSTQNDNVDILIDMNETFVDLGSWLERGMTRRWRRVFAPNGDLNFEHDRFASD